MSALAPFSHAAPGPRPEHGSGCFRCSSGAGCSRSRLPWAFGPMSLAHRRPGRVFRRAVPWFAGDVPDQAPVASRGVVRGGGVLPVHRRQRRPGEGTWTWPWSGNQSTSRPGPARACRAPGPRPAGPAPAPVHRPQRARVESWFGWLWSGLGEWRGVASDCPRAKACVLSIKFPGTQPRPLVYSLAFAARTVVEWS